MKIENEYQCRACQFVLSHPVDACPVCTMQFYWRVLPNHSLKKSRIADYVIKMERLVNGRVSREFLTHGGYLWLPYNFWEFCPDGDLLKEFSWISEIKFYQHEPAKQQSQAPVSEDASPWDTNPALPIINPADKPVEPGWTAAKPGFNKSLPDPHPKQSIEAGSGKEDSGDREWFAPLMVLIFFIMLSLSYLVLRYHKNTRFPMTTPASKVIFDDYQILS